MRIAFSRDLLKIGLFAMNLKEPALSKTDYLCDIYAFL